MKTDVEVQIAVARLPVDLAVADEAIARLGATSSRAVLDANDEGRAYLLEGGLAGGPLLLPGCP